MNSAADDSTGDALRAAAQELIRATRGFLDAAEVALADDERMTEWAERGREVVNGFLTGFTSPRPGDAPPDDDPGIERIDLD
ncbi:MAG: hypothetical protein OEW42_19725 [Acidimicrobiia bacterium]|nr:hypothetical protein [Acidimicrobiia bacterium]